MLITAGAPCLWISDCGLSESHGGPFTEQQILPSLRGQEEKLGDTGGAWCHLRNIAEELRIRAAVFRAPLALLLLPLPLVRETVQTVQTEAGSHLEWEKERVSQFPTSS